jgi:D-glycero-beta-D-manno-heptose 1-phosphate adenylyltransferase
MKRVFGYSKIINKKALQKVVNKLKREGKIIVTTNGSFDILHAGHAYLLQRAKQYGDVLIVGLNSDSSIRRYKGRGRPIIPQKYRAQLLSALNTVDYIYIFNELNPIHFLTIVKPNIHVNSAEYGKNCIEAPTVKKFGGKLILISRRGDVLQSTKIIQKIIKVHQK